MRHNAIPRTRISATSLDRARPPACAIVAFLQLSPRRLFFLPATGDDFAMGRDPAQCAMLLTEPVEISGRHAWIQRHPDRVIVIDQNSQNGARGHGKPDRNVSVLPGQVFNLGGTDFVALSQPMVEQLEDLILYAGRNPHLPELLTLLQAQHLILIGAHGTPLEEISRAAHRAVASDASPFVVMRGLRTVDAHPRVLKAAVNGRIFLDGRGTPRRSAAPSFSGIQLGHLRQPCQLTSLTVAVTRADHVDILLAERKPFYFRVASVWEQIRDGDLDELIDLISVKWNVPYMAEMWPTELKELLKRRAWPRDHKQFTAVVVAVGRMRAGLSEHMAVQGLGPSRTVKDWLEELGFHASRVRAAAWR